MAREMYFMMVFCRSANCNFYSDGGRVLRFDNDSRWEVQDQPPTQFLKNAEFDFSQFVPDDEFSDLLESLEHGTDMMANLTRIKLNESIMPPTKQGSPSLILAKRGEDNLAVSP